MIDMALEGEIIPPHILQDIFPQKEFQGRKFLFTGMGICRTRKKRH